MALSVDEIRTYTKDTPEFNILLEGDEQSEVSLIALAMKLAVSEFNSMPPVTSYVVDNFPSDAILLMGTLYCLANSEAERQLRNQVSFSTQGGQASIDDKYQQYINLATMYKSLFDQRALPLKQHLNTEAAWGESFSPYIGINDFDFRS
jgi:hypothetical protein